MSIIIKKGETRPITFKIKEEKDNMFSNEDILLFAIKNNDNEVIFTDKKPFANITKENDLYLYTIELSSSFTNRLVPNHCKYYFDLTLLRGEKKIPMSDIFTFEVEDTVGASIEV